MVIGCVFPKKWRKAREIFNPTNVEKNALLPFLKARYFIILSSKEIKSYKKQTYLAILSLGRSIRERNT